jgi:DNA repair exonuclease SbcCD ATPase subunit
VELWKGSENITKDSITNTDKFICDLIGTNSTLCKSCDILSLSDNIPFMGKTAAEKRKFIEDIFSLEVFGKMSKELKEGIKNIQKDINTSTTKVDEIDKSVKTLLDQQEAFKKQLEEREGVLIERKRDLQSKLNNVLEQIENEPPVEDTDKLNLNRKDLDDLQNKIDLKIGTINSSIGERNATTKILKIELSSIYDIKTAPKCDKCLQDIPHAHIDHLQNLKVELLKNIKNTDEEIEKLNVSKQDLFDKKKKVQDKRADIQNRLSDCKLKQQKIENLNRLVKEYTASLEDVEKEFNSKKDSNDIFTDAILETEKRKEEELKQLLEYKQKEGDLDVCKFILSEEGIKSFTIKKLLKILNDAIQGYITDLGMSMRCSFDEYLDEKLTNDHGTEISYWNLSGGERRTVDLACAWAFKDLKRKISGISANVEFCDEIFDSAFDERGLDLLIDVLKDRIEKQGMSIYAISHRKETVKHIDGEIVYLEKENRTTKRIKD